MSKPTENFNFAESAPAANIAEPSASRPGGYNFREPLPHNEANWLYRTLMRGVRWLLGLFDDDGWLTMGSTYGRLRVTSDTTFLHEIKHEDVGGLLTRFSANLTAGDVALEVGLYGQLQRTEDDGDLSQITHANNEGGAGRLEAQLRSGSLAPLDAAPAVGSALKRTEALFLNNLLKCSATISITYDGSGVPSATLLDAHNATNPAIIAPIGAFPLAGLLLDTIDDFAPATITWSAAPAAANTATPIIAYITPLIGPTTRFHVTVLADTGAGLTDALGTRAALAGFTITITLMST
jgi:hypothetical protein